MRQKEVQKDDWMNIFLANKSTAIIKGKKGRF